MPEDEGGERVKDSRSGPVNEARTDFSRRMCSSRSLRGTCGSSMSLSIEPQECTSRPHVQLKQKHSDIVLVSASKLQASSIRTFWYPILWVATCKCTRHGRHHASYKYTTVLHTLAWQAHGFIELRPWQHDRWTILCWLPALASFRIASAT